MHVDVLVIGGGIQGVGVAQAAAAAGYAVAVVEKTALAAGTSSRSSKLIHGGLRYLESGQFALVRKSILERERLIKLAPHLVKPTRFYIPVYRDSTRQPWLIRLGLSLYSLLGNLHSYARFRSCNVSPVKQLATNNLKKVFCYYDGQTDDAALTRAVMQSAQQLGAALYCPAEITRLKFEKEMFHAVLNHANSRVTMTAKVVVNATGPWVNNVITGFTELKLASMAFDCVAGTHIELNVPAPEGVIYVEAPQDKRAVFIMPWHERTLVGTTETLYHGDPATIEATPAEIEYLCAVYRHYFPAIEFTVVNHFAGIRVLPKADSSMFNRPRDTVIYEAMPQFVSLYGGKLTSYRATAEQVLDKIKCWLPTREKKADTATLKLN